MVNKVLVKAVFYFVSSSLMCINFMWYKQMLRQLWACKGERILNQPGSWMLCVYKLLLFLTIVREIYRRTDGKYRNLQPNSISMSKGDNSLPTFHLPKTNCLLYTMYCNQSLPSSTNSHQHSVLLNIHAQNNN